MTVTDDFWRSDLWEDDEKGWNGTDWAWNGTWAERPVGLEEAGGLDAVPESGNLYPRDDQGEPCPKRQRSK